MAHLSRQALWASNIDQSAFIKREKAQIKLYIYMNSLEIHRR